MNQITGSPAVYKVGRRLLLVSYISVGEWQTFGLIVEKDETYAVTQLIYWSLRRATPGIRKPNLRWWNKKALAGLVTFICNLGMPLLPKGTKTSQQAAEGAKRPADDNSMKTAYRQLSRMHGWTPQEISDMSPAQIHSYLSGGKDGTGIEKMSGAEYKSFRAQRGLSIGSKN